MTDKLALYNGAGALLKQERVALTDDVLLVRELDAVYDATLIAFLEEGYWKVALRSILIEPDPSIDTSTFGGKAYGYTLPDDLVHFSNINNSPDFNASSELTDYDYEGGSIVYANAASFYLRYVSSDPQFGLNLGAWSAGMEKACGARLAERVALRVTKSDDDRDGCEKLGDKWTAQAKVRDAVDLSVKERPVGRLIRSRFGSYSRRSRGPLWG